MTIHSLQAASALVFGYLFIGEAVGGISGAAAKATRVLQHWAVQQIILLAALSGLLVLSGGSCSRRGCSSPVSAAWLLLLLNIVPIAVAFIASLKFAKSDNCPSSCYDGAPHTPCDRFAISLDVIGLLTARLSRLDLGISLLLSARGKSSWLLSATGGWLGYAEAIPLHRSAGWWCAAQSALHSIGYLIFYLESGGLQSLWLNCFPAALPNGKLNRLGLVNFLGIVAFVFLILLMLPAYPPLRTRLYHTFQLLHLPAAALFVVCCALHDLPILLFAVPGIASWYMEWRGRGGKRCSSRRLSQANVQLLPGT